MRVLLAEPTRIGRTIMAGMLAEAGYDVVAVESVEAALSVMEADEAVEILITAIEFATLSGFELCWEARLRASGERPLYVIVMSSSRDEAKLVEALDSGADDFVTKPPKRNELLARLRQASRLLQAQKQLINQANFDALTGLRNRRSFFDSESRMTAAGGPWSVIMLDIDYFKQVNDKHGHDAGDDVLRVVGQRLVQIDRNFSRLGGEEFALLMPGRGSDAGQVAELVRGAIASLPVETCAGPLAITASMGVAEIDRETGLSQAMKNADIALYASKSGGRNRVTISATRQEGPGGVVQHALVA